VDAALESSHHGARPAVSLPGRIPIPPGYAAVCLGLGEGALDCGHPFAHGVEPAGHLPTLKAGCQKLRGQKKIEMKY
jgi:hypothetical protein